MPQSPRLLLLLLIVLVGASTTGGCGVKGPLYIPEPETAGSQKEAAPEDEPPVEDELPY